jgi:hypothetical protein
MAIFSPAENPKKLFVQFGFIRSRNLENDTAGFRSNHWV